MALYHKIAEFIMEKIKTEEWKKGQLIPSEKEFCEQFQVSRPTVRAAIAYLANQGYLVTVKGKGTFVSKPKIVEDTTVFLESFSKEMATKGISVQTEVLEQRMIAADEEVASKLKVPCGDEVDKLRAHILELLSALFAELNVGVTKAFSAFNCSVTPCACFICSISVSKRSCACSLMSTR